MKIITPANIALLAAAAAIDRFGSSQTLFLAMFAVVAAVICFEFVKGLYTPNC